MVLTVWIQRCLWRAQLALASRGAFWLSNQTPAIGLEGKNTLMPSRIIFIQNFLLEEMGRIPSYMLQNNSAQHKSISFLLPQNISFLL